MLHIVYNEDNRTLDLPDNYISLTITSPPYWNSIAYDVHSKDPNLWYRTRESKVDYKGYLHELALSFWEVYRVTQPGRMCAVVIGTVLEGGKHIPLPFDFVRLMDDLGWEFHQDIVWHKCTGGVKRAGSYIQNPYPGYYYPNIMTEYIMVFRKPGDTHFKWRGRSDHKAPIDDLFTKEIANNVWHIAPVPPNESRGLHPCPFPSEIPYRLITLYSDYGETVLDNYCGIGTTLVAAEELGRDSVGYDTCEDYCRTARERVNKASPGNHTSRRSEQLVARFDKLPTEGD